MPERGKKHATMEAELDDLVTQLRERVATAVNKRVMVHLGQSLGWMTFDIHPAGGADQIKIEIFESETEIHEAVTLWESGRCEFQLLSAPNIAGPTGLTAYRLTAVDARRSTLGFKVKYLKKLIEWLNLPEVMVMSQSVAIVEHR